MNVLGLVVRGLPLASIPLQVTNNPFTCVGLAWRHGMSCVSCHEAFMSARVNGAVVIATWLQNGASMFAKVNDMAVIAAWFCGKRFGA